MKFKISILLVFLASCEKPAPITRAPEARHSTPPSTNPTLAAAQLALAKTHLENNSPGKALPYLLAASENNPDEKNQSLLADILAKTRFTVPITRFTHPFPVSTFVRSETSLFAAISGPHPTVVRWDLTEIPHAAAILFPTGPFHISHLELSPSGKHLLVQRGATNLLCLAESLKPITSLGSFPAYLHAADLQPFSENSLLFAHPTANDRTFTFHIRDSTTGETIRSESFPLFPKPTSAYFQGTSLTIYLEDSSRIEIPIIGKTIHTPSRRSSTDMSPPGPIVTGGLRNLPPPPPIVATQDGDAITITLAIPTSLLPSTPPSLIPALTGYRLNPVTQSLEIIPTPERLEILSKTFPKIPRSFTIHTSKTAVENRLAAAYPDLYTKISAPSRAHAGIIRETFATGDPSSITAALRALPPSGLPTATALLLSLESGNPAYIDLVYKIAKDIPPPLLALKYPAANLTQNDLTTLREEQDWLGYESPDFSAFIQDIEKQKASLLTKIQLPVNPTEQDIQTLITHLLSPQAQQSLPREHLAAIAISSAQSLAEHQSLATSALHLALVAQRLGTPQPVILRTQATAFTTLADFDSAHRNWLDLITHQPEATHLPSDYSEAAYTAFENADPRQAIEILNTGLFRFPEDATFAIRAGWIALLTDYHTEALSYLVHATQLGLPASETENTTALLAIAHLQTGDTETALSFMEQLKAIDESWADPDFIEKLTWPDPFKASLRQLTWQP